MDVAQVERDGVQGQVYLPGHEVEVVDVRREAEAGIAAALVGRQHQLAAVYLELHQAETRCLVGLRTRLAEEQHVVLAVAPLAVDAVDERGQLLEVGGVAVDQYRPAVVPPLHAHLAVPLGEPLATHEQLQLVAQLLAGDVMRLEDVEQVGGRKLQPLVEQVGYRSFFVLLHLAFRKDFPQQFVVFVHRLIGV